MNYVILFIVGLMIHLVWGRSKKRNAPKFRFGESGDFGGGADYEETNASSEQRNTVQATPEEEEVNKLNLGLRRAAQPGLLNLQDLSLALAGSLAGGGTDLPGAFGRLPGGISPEVTQDIVDKSLKDVGTAAQFSGILDSGTAGELGAQAASNVRTQSEQFNIQNLLQLLGLAFGGQAQVQQPINQQSAILSNALAGLRSTQSNLTSQSQTFGANANFEVSAGDAASLAAVASDKRLKNDIKYITNGILKFATWSWNKIAKELYNLEGVDSGYIAQDVKELYPEAVIEDTNGYLLINYDKLVDMVA